MSKKNKTKEFKDRKKISITGNSEVDNMIKIFSLVLIIFLIFFGITYLLVDKNKKDDDSAVGKEIQYKVIMAGRILDMPEKSYYVYVINKDDPYNKLYNEYLSDYSSKNDALPYYEVDLSDSFNKDYVSEESKLNVTKVEELKFSKSSLLKIEDGKIVLAVDEKDKIVEHLKSLLD